MPTVTAIIPIYKPSSAMLNKCLRCVLPQVDEVIVTREETGAVLPSNVFQHPKIRYVVTQATGIGFGRNVNFGSRHATSDFLLHLNDDVYLAPNAVEMMLAVAAKDVGIVGHLLLYPDGRIYHAGKIRNRDGTIGYEHLDYGQRAWTIIQPTEVENVCGASMLVRREAFNHVGGYDPEYLFHGSDDDLCMKIRQAGWQIIYTPFAVGEHDFHKERDNAPFSWKMELRKSRRRFAEKWEEKFQS